MEISEHITSIKGVGGKKAESLKKLKIERVEDLLYFYPRDYQDRRSATEIKDLVPGKPSLIKARVSHISKSTGYYGKKQLLKLQAGDESASLEVVFFNAKYLANAFKPDTEYYFYGKVTDDNGKRRMLHPEFIRPDEASETGIVPIYPLTAGISQSEMRRWQRAAGVFVDEIDEYMPEDIVKKNNLCGIRYALQNIHFPGDGQKLKEARFRLVFDELFLLQAGLLSIKASGFRDGGGIEFPKIPGVGEFITGFPYKLTNAQTRVVGEITGDMESKKVMNRLVQGDVGCGKTAVAEIALYKACLSGYQGVLMAPTELLARQHFNNLKRDFEPFGIEVAFLSGSMSPKEREETLKRLKSGKIGILVGTHAIIQPDVEFGDLGLVITDEQHRFGVNQRQKLSQKGKSPDVLVMSATPIPRTLAMILYGDLDISIIDELPPGRRKIITRAARGKQRSASYEFIRREIQAGRQAYVVAPLIDDSDAIDARSAESIFKDLVKRFSEYNVALLHGEMKQKEKDEIMGMFYEGRIDVLVSTVVIEVGINVPNATVMLIENAERFGLAQMHQLRGRVGRGSENSYCILITESGTKLAEERAETMVKTSDGFEIAEKDLEFRWPGEFFGTRQHGLPDLRIADLLRHIEILETVREEARLLLREDKDLSMPEHSGVKRKLRAQFGLIL